AKSTPPSVFPLVPCCTKTGSPPPDTSLACLVTGYLPSPVKITWNSGKVTQGVKNFPEVTMSDGLHTRSSLLILPDRSRQGDTYQCDVTHEGTAKTVSKKFLQECKTCGVGRTGHSTESHDTVTLLCSASGYYPRDLQLTWQAGGKEREGTQVRLLQGKDGRFSSSSNLTMSQAEWDKLGEYSCHVTHPGTGSTQLSTSTCQGSIPLPSLYLLKPSLEDLLTRGEALLTCLAVGYELGQARLTWELDGANWTANATLGEAKTHSNQTQSLLSHLTIPRGVWDSRSSILCRVTHPCSLGIPRSPIASTTQSQRSLKAPTIYLLSPSSEEICSNQNLTLHCIVKDFYPSEISIWWQEKTAQTEVDIPADDEHHNCDHNSQQCSVISKLEVSRSKWILGTSYSCLVAHLSSEGIIARSANVHTGKTHLSCFISAPKSTLHLNLKIPLLAVPHSFQFGLCLFPMCVSFDSAQMKTSFTCLPCVHFTSLLKQ
uniref:Ig-like domain-containing protein n=1 Tax=Terrapene triunguis TaxID=2587831 RepID=A0A674IBU3_9SAUR